MGGGDLNLKKSWHPQTLRNIERVWKAEQKHEDERRKIEQLQAELKEEKAREDMRMFAEEQGAVRKKDERLNWMYQGQPEVNRDDYLLGKPIDKAIQDITVGKTEDSDLASNVPGAIFSQSSVNSAVDMAAKIREDPLFAIKQREQQSKKELLNNPVKMKQLQHMLKATLDKKEKKKKKKDKKKKHKKHKRANSSDSEDGARGGRGVDGYPGIKSHRSRSRSMSPKVKHRSKVRRASSSDSEDGAGARGGRGVDGYPGVKSHRSRSRSMSPSSPKIKHRSKGRRSRSLSREDGAGARVGRGVNGHPGIKSHRSRSRSMSPKVKHRSKVRRSRSRSKSPPRSGNKHKARFSSSQSPVRSKDRRRSRTPSPSRSKVRRSRTPSPRSKGMRRSVTPERLKGRKTTHSASKSKSSRQRDSGSRSPPSKGRQHRSRSPVMSRSPVKRKSRSPIRRRSRSPVRRSPRRSESPPPKRNGPSMRKGETAKRKIDPEELARRRREMMEDAKARDDERWQRVQKYKEDAAREKEEDEKFRGKERAFHGLLTETAASVEDRIKRKVNSLQRTEAAKEKFFNR